MNFEKVLILRNKRATSSAVLKNLNDFSVVHFSCHGYANLLEPLTSGLMMANNESLSVKSLLDLKLDGIRIATLSACETGIPGTSLPDEVINMPSALIQAGTAGIVSSLWAVSELSALMLMIRFYDNWREKTKDPAEAFCKAQKWVRDSTSAQKDDYLAKIAKKKGWSDEEMKKIFEGIDETNFADLHNWAAFIYTGV